MRIKIERKDPNKAVIIDTDITKQTVAIIIMGVLLMLSAVIMAFQWDRIATLNNAGERYDRDIIAWRTATYTLAQFSTGDIYEPESVFVVLRGVFSPGSQVVRYWENRMGPFGQDTITEGGAR